mgnify:CR=1 FL=1
MTRVTEVRLSGIMLDSYMVYIYLIFKTHIAYASGEHDLTHHWEVFFTEPT